MDNTAKKTIMILDYLQDERADIAIQESKKCGYRVVVCSPKDFVPLHDKVDQLYIMDYSDSTRLLQIAKDEHINGVVGLFDGAVVPAATIAETLGLPGNSTNSVAPFLSKNAFRFLQKEAGVFYPQNVPVSDEIPLQEIKQLSFPVIVKPEFCSSSFGQSVVQAYDEEELLDCIHRARSYSRNNCASVEEYVKHADDPLRIVEGEAFVVNDDLLLEGLRYSYRTTDNPLRPVYDVYPTDLTDERKREVRNTVGALLNQAGVTNGEFNFEGFFTTDGHFFVVEMNPRQPGLYNPVHVQLHCGVDLTKLLVTTAVGDQSYYDEVKQFKRTNRVILPFSAFCKHSGIFESLFVDDSLKDKIIDLRYFDGKTEGAYLEGKDTAHSPAAKITFEFSDTEELESYRQNIEKLVYPIVTEETI